VYKRLEMDDFESIKESGQRLDVLVGGLASGVLGNASQYLRLGGGMNVEIQYAGTNRILYGLNMSFTGNGLKAEYPISTTREMISPLSGFVGFSVGKWLNGFSIQGDIGFAVHNITEKIDANDDQWVQLKGWNGGLGINLPVSFGNATPSIYAGAPTLLDNSLNLHLGFRYVHYPLEEARGMMIELGVGYRMSLKGIEEYKLKEGVF